MRKIFLTRFWLLGLVIATNFTVNGQSTITELIDFNTTTQLTDLFNPDTSPVFTNISDQGLSNSGSVNVPLGNTDLWTSKQAFTVTNGDASYTFSAFFKIAANSGYGGLGFTAASTNEPDSFGAPPIGIGMIFHGGGGYFRNNSSNTSVSWPPDLVLGNWYKMVFQVDRVGGSDDFDLTFWIYNTDANGNVGTLKTQHQLTVTNADMAASDKIHVYFSAAGSRMEKIDNYEYSLAGGTSIVEEGEAVAITGSAASITDSEAQLSGEVGDDGGSAVTERGICYGLNPNPTVDDTKSASGSGSGSFSTVVTGLPPGTTIYYRAYAINSSGTSYGANSSFETAPNNPPLVTSPASGFDVSSGTYLPAATFRYSAQDTGAYGLAFNHEGTKMFIVGRDNDTVAEYALATPFDPASASFTTGFYIGGEEGVPQDLVFSADGSKMYITGLLNDLLIEYQLSTPFDVTSATYNAADSFDPSPEVTSPIALNFSQDGSIMLVMDSTTESLYQYALTTPFDVSTASYTGNSFFVGGEQSSVRNFAINDRGTKFFTIGNGGSSVGDGEDAIVEYVMTTPYDLGTASYSGPQEELVVGYEDGQPLEVAFDPTGENVFILGYNNEKVYKYALSNLSSYPENSTAPVADIEANDGDGGANDTGITYSLAAGGDNDHFSIDSSSGLLEFLAAPDFEAPQDANTDNSYELTILISDGGMQTTYELAVRVTDVDEVAPSGYQVYIQQAEIDSNNETAVDFRFYYAETGATFDYTFTSDNGGTPVSGTGTISYAYHTESGIDLSGLEDGTITLTATLTDPNGNAGNPVTDTVLKETDSDDDGVKDTVDNCPDTANATQTDTDSDGSGDACDTDDDNDGTPDADDAFPLDENEDTDTDGDGTGDNADMDDDGDGAADTEDAFPLDPTEDTDTDGDGLGNNADTDDDNDGTPDDSDDLPLDPTETTDTDGDGLGNNADADDDNDGTADAEDAFPLDPAEDTDTDNDGTGDNADTDDDNDGTEDTSDAFPSDPAENTDTDGDGIGNNADTDDDNDGTPDNEDAFPLDENEDTDTDGDGTGNNSDADDDNDGTADTEDDFPLDGNETTDTDGDGTGDNADADDDNDGVTDTADAFPQDPSETEDTDGDGVGNNTDTDDDGDGSPDTEDAFPLDAGEHTDSDNDGTGDNSDSDDDNDGVSDEADAFPLDPHEALDTDGDGIGNNADPDDDGDGDTDEEEMANGTDPLDPESYFVEEEDTSVSETEAEPLIPAEAFTPNGDGMNDAWVVPGIENYPNNMVKVYNRWGHVVFEVRSYQNNWEGFYKSRREKLPPGSYLYVIDLGNGSAPLQGWIFINY